MNHGEAFRPPLEKASDPRSCFAAVVLIGIVYTSATASPSVVAPAICFGVRSARDFGIGLGHSPSTYLICGDCAIVALAIAHAGSPDGTRLPHLPGQPIDAVSAGSRYKRYGFSKGASPGNSC